MTRIAAIILASLSVIAGAKADDGINTNDPSLCLRRSVLTGKVVYFRCSDVASEVSARVCPSGWLPVTVGDQTWCARELRAPGGE